MEYLAINSPVSLNRVIVLQSWFFQLPSLQPQWQVAAGGARRVGVTEQEVSGKAREPRPGGAVFSGDLLNSGQHTDVAGLRFQRFYIVWAFQKQTLTGKGPWET